MSKKNRVIKGTVELVEEPSVVSPNTKLSQRESEEKKRIFKEVQKSMSTMYGNSIEVYLNNEKPCHSRTKKVEVEAKLSSRRKSFHRLTPLEVLELQGY